MSKEKKYVDQQVLYQLKADIEEFDKIFLVLGERKILDNFLKLVCASEAVKKEKKKILILGSLKEWVGDEVTVTYRQIIEDESRQLYRLYSMYEFSDKFQIISEVTALYGSLFQLVNTGLLSPRESVAALLY